MKSSDIKPGVAYWRDPNSKWRQYPTGGVEVTIADPSARYIRRGYGGYGGRVTYHPVAEGKYLRAEATLSDGTKVENLYVLPAELRGTVEDAKAEIEKTGVSSEARQAALFRGERQARVRAARIVQRLAALDIKIGYQPAGVQVDTLGSSITIKMGPDRMEEILTMLEDREQR